MSQVDGAAGSVNTSKHTRTGMLRRVWGRGEEGETERLRGAKEERKDKQSRLDTKARSPASRDPSTAVRADDAGHGVPAGPRAPVGEVHRTGAHVTGQLLERRRDAVKHALEVAPRASGSGAPT